MAHWSTKAGGRPAKARSTEAERIAGYLALEQLSATSSLYLSLEAAAYRQPAPVALGCRSTSTRQIP